MRFFTLCKLSSVIPAVGFWNDFAAQLPRQDTPLKNRMINCHPAVKTDTVFTVTAGNQMMADEILQAKDRIL